MDWLAERNARQYSVEDLKEIYAELLRSLDLNNESLGRRRADARDRAATPMEFGKQFLWRGVNLIEKISRNEGNDDMQRAYRILSATLQLENESDSGWAVELRNEELIKLLSIARNLVERVVQLLNDLAEVVTHGNTSVGITLKCNPVFEYFCEKSMMSLLVEIQNTKPGSIPRLHGVTWNPLVKSQVLRTVATIITNTQHGPSLYYLLSNNGINELLSGMIPLKQWTNRALEIMLPAFVALMKGLSQHLIVEPAGVSMFLRVGDGQRQHFPLFVAMVEIATYPKMESSIRSACLQLLVGVMSVRNSAVADLVHQCEIQQTKLCRYLCSRVNDRCTNLTKLVIGPVVDARRCNLVQAHLKDLSAQLTYINHIFRCGVQSLNVRLCEMFLRSVVGRLLHNLLPQERKILAVGTTDTDVVPQVEASAQTSLVVLVHCFGITYPPLVRMLAVALFHPTSTDVWAGNQNGFDEYVVTRKLNAIVCGEDNSDSVPNAYRQHLLAVLAGDLGEWTFVPASMMLEAVISGKATSNELLSNLRIVSKPTDETAASEFEGALTKFFLRKHTNQSLMSRVALERACATAMQLLCKTRVSCDKHGVDSCQRVASSPLHGAVHSCLKRCCEKAISLRKRRDVSQLFVELVQSEIRARYSVLSNEHKRGNQSLLGCHLDYFHWNRYLSKAELLVRKFRVVGSNEVADTRFFLQMVLHLRAVCKAVDKWCERRDESTVKVPAIEWADREILSVGDLLPRPAKGTDLDLRGLTTFRFQPSSAQLAQTANRHERPEDVAIRFASQLVLVLGKSDIIIAKPLSARAAYRGVILCVVPLCNIIAFASDNEWLHVAVRNLEDVLRLVKNGKHFCWESLSFSFDSMSTKGTWHCNLTLRESVSS